MYITNWLSNKGMTVYIPHSSMQWMEGWWCVASLVSLFTIHLNTTSFGIRLSANMTTSLVLISNFFTSSLLVFKQITSLGDNFFAYRKQATPISCPLEMFLNIYTGVPVGLFYCTQSNVKSIILVAGETNRCVMRLSTPLTGLHSSFVTIGIWFSLACFSSLSISCLYKHTFITPPGICSVSLLWKTTSLPRVSELVTYSFFL